MMTMMIVVIIHLGCEHLELKLRIDRGSRPFVERNFLVMIDGDEEVGDGDGNHDLDGILINLEVMWRWIQQRNVAKAEGKVNLFKDDDR